ncbi:MAG: HAMP domain-containing sensor histidine kinase [Bacteroidota bacterium]|nr:HAMP domain-containing sensor histidine kinase [Bacteroidota bacterium]
MKLQNKINIRFSLITLLVFSVAGLYFYYKLERSINHNIKEMLASRKGYVMLYLRQHSPTDTVIVSPDNSIFIKTVPKIEPYQRFSDTLIFDEDEKELAPARKLTFSYAVNENYYEVIITQSLLESDDLQKIIFYFMVALFVVVLLALSILNRWLSASAWKPFFNSLSLLKSFKIGENSNIQFDKSGIDEFDQLNEILNGLIQKVQADFINLKEFSENASHEIQTPLAIIKSKLEMVLQDKTLTDQQHRQIHAAFESAIRLSKLNSALLLLSKIENRQFVETENIDIIELIKSRLEYLQELIELRQLEVITQFEGEFVVNINPVLAEILINNLLSNAMKHNAEHGSIRIVAGNDEISVCNPGLPLTIEPSKLFERFVKHKTSGDSTGLGLAIANEICKSFHLTLRYEYRENLHCLILSR